MPRLILVTLLVSLSIVANLSADEFFEHFKDSYSMIDLSLEGSPGEIAEVSNFIYKKDVAEFRFDGGRLHLLRFIDGRPTAAIFIGQGSARIEVPVPVEKRSLLAVTGDSVVEESFEVCFIRMSDDFDLRLKEQFAFEDEHLDWRDFNAAAKGNAQGELFFKPMIKHTYDNYFQLLRSNFERAEDGYFWIDFNRYNFCFDPNRPEEVRISYEFEGGDVVATEAAVFQRNEAGKYNNADLSQIQYPTTPLDLSGKLEMGGLDGRTISNGEGRLRVVVNEDSLRFVSLFLHFNLKLDSVYYGAEPVDYWRRKDFQYLGVILPRYHYKGDTLDFTLWYQGNNYDAPFPSVEDPTPIMHSFDIIFPNGYNYVITDRSATSKYDDKNEICSVATQRPYHHMYLQGYASGYDTIAAQTEMGMQFNFLKSRHIKKGQECFITDDSYQQAALGAFNFFAAHTGAPTGTFVEYVYPEGYLLTMPGLIKLPQLACVTNGTMEAIGGFHALAGYTVARQWYGAAVQPVSDREYWLEQAVPGFMAMWYLESALEGSEYYSNLLFKRDSVHRVTERGRDIPLTCGQRESESISFRSVYANKGAWIFHMLRFLMFDTETGSDQAFTRFLYELIFTANNKRFSNNDVQQLAEKYYGQPLDWFFDQWVYGVGFPEFKVEYGIAEDGGKYYVEASVVTEKVPASFEMPVIIRVADQDGNKYFRERITAGNQSIKLGPFDSEPKKMFFNEFFSVLSKDDVKKK